MRHTKLEDEEPLQLVRRRKKNRELDRPKDQVANHLLRSNANRFRDMVGDVKIRRPDSSDTLSHCGGASIRLNGVPEEGSYHTGHDGEARKVPSE